MLNIVAKHIDRVMNRAERHNALGIDFIELLNIVQDIVELAGHCHHLFITEAQLGQFCDIGNIFGGNRHNKIFVKL